MHSSQSVYELYIFAEAATAINPEYFFHGHMGQGMTEFWTLVDFMPFGSTLYPTGIWFVDAAMEKLLGFAFLSSNRYQVGTTNVRV